MGFEKLPDNRGMIYVPECVCAGKKNPCSDCFSCQWCSNERCRVCRGRRGGIGPNGDLLNIGECLPAGKSHGGS